MLWSEAVKAIALKSPGIVSKLRLSPSKSGIKRVIAHEAVAQYAEYLKRTGNEIIAIEPKVEDGYKVEADIIYKNRANEIIYLDVTTSTDSTILAQKARKAIQISKTESIKYTVYISPGVSIKNPNIACKLIGPHATVFKIIENTLDKTIDEKLLQARANQISDLLLHELSNTKRLSLDRRWSKIPIDFLSSNSPSSVFTTLEILTKTFPEFTSAIGKIATMASRSKRALFYLAPADNSRSSPHKFIETISLVPKDNNKYKITTNYEIVLTDSFTRDLFVEDPTVLAIVKRRFDKLGNFFYDNRYIIKFNRAFIGEEMASSIDRTTNKRVPNDLASSMFKDLPESNISSILNALHDFERVSELSAMSIKITDEEASDVYTKMCTISTVDVDSHEASEESIARVSREKIALLIASLQKTIAGQIISHYHEVAKSVAASIGKSSRRNEYFIGRNGNYNSYTLVKCTGTQDSFKSSPYMVFYKPHYSSNLIKDFVAKYDIKDGFIVTSRRMATKNIINWHIKLPFVFTNLVAWHVEQRESVLSDMASPPKDFVSSSAIFSVINRDPFAQVADLTRYWYGSSVGDFSDVIGLIKKYDTYIYKYFSEVVYIARQFKMAAALKSYSLMETRHIEVTDSQGSSAIPLVMPHLNTVIAENSATISMFYISNIFNKFKYNEEVSSAICYLQIKEELELFAKADSEFKAGLSRFNLNVSSLAEIILDDDKFNNELKFMSELIKRGSERFQCSIVATYIYSRLLGPRVDYDTLYMKLGEAPIEALTLRGGMDSKELSSESQSIRSASTLIEGIIESFNLSAHAFNVSIMDKYDIMKKLENADVSILSLKNIQYAMNKEYAYRIVHKDQKGHREISVLNYNMRIATMFIEAIFKVLSEKDDTDLLMNHDKLRVVQNYIREIDYRNKKVIFDNTDQSRWGPNVLLHHFAAMTSAVLNADSGLSRLCLDSLNSMTMKKAKIPDCLLTLIKKGHTKYSNISAVGMCMNFILPLVADKSYSLVMSPGMGQGILHQTSSTLHVIKRRVTTEIIKRLVPDCKIKDFTTSDDNTSVIEIAKHKIIDITLESKGDDETSIISSDNKVSIETIYLTVNKFTDNLFNIIRNKAKSFTSRKLMDFNSSFYMEECLAVPSLKQRVSYIDCGEGYDFISDMISATSTGSSYLASGGSYLGSLMLTISNMTLVLDQHRGWFKYKADNRSMSARSIFAMGIPVIEPVTNYIYGPMTAVVLREISVTGLPASVILRALFNNISMPPSIVEQEDIIRGSIENKHTETFRYLMPTSISGLTSLFRPQKLQSRFIRRHRLNTFQIDESKIHYRKGYPSFANLLFTATLGVGTKITEDALGVNNFLIRFTEPWIGIDSKKFIIADNPFAREMYGVGKLSIREVEAISANITNEKITKCYMKLSETSASDISSVLVSTMSELMVPARELLIRLSNTPLVVSAKPEKVRYSHCEVSLPHKIFGNSNDIRRSMIFKLYSGDNKIFFSQGSDITFGVMIESMLYKNKTNSLKEAILMADILYNSIMKYIRTSSTAIIKTKADFAKYENLANFFIGRMYTSTVQIAISVNMTKLAAPLTYVTFNKAVNDKLINSRDNISKLAARKFLDDENKELLPKLYIQSSKKVVQNAQSISSFVPYETGVAFKFTSETVRSYSEDVLALSGYDGPILITKSFFKSFANQTLGANAFIKLPDRLIKTLELPAKCKATIEGMPIAIINERVQDMYVSTLVIMAPKVIDTCIIADFNTAVIGNENAWRISLHKALIGSHKDGDTKILATSKKTGKPTDILKVKFISEETVFKLSLNLNNVSFTLVSNDLILPLRSNIIYNRALIAEEFSSYTWPVRDLTIEDQGASLAKLAAFINYSISTEGSKKLDEYVRVFNKANFPVTSVIIDKLFDIELKTKKTVKTVRQLAIEYGCDIFMLDEPDVTLSYIIMAINSKHKLMLRSSTLSRTLLKPGASSDFAPLFYESSDLNTKVAPSKVLVIKGVKTESKDESLKPIEEEDAMFDRIPDEEEEEEDREFLEIMRQELENPTLLTVTMSSNPTSDIKVLDEAYKAMSDLPDAASKDELDLKHVDESQNKIENKMASDIAGSTIWSDAVFDYKAMTADVAVEETHYDIRLLEANNLNSAIIEEARASVMSAVRKMTSENYDLFSSNQFEVSPDGDYDSTALSILSAMKRSIGASAFMFLIMS
jgi:hypothetical protein